MINMRKTIISLSIAASVAFGAFNAVAVNPLDALGSILSSATSTTKFEIADIVGTWNYQSPAVSFKSDQALGKIGGMAAGTALEDKLTQYYNAIGINTLVVTVNSDETFSMKIKSATLSGTLTKDDDSGALTFHFNAFGKMNIGSIAAKAEKSALNDLTLTFDATKLITVAEKVSSIVKIQSLQTVVSLLKSYDGLYIGARLKKSSSASGTSGSAPSSGANPASGGSDAGSKAAEALKNLLKK